MINARPTKEILRKSEEERTLEQNRMPRVKPKPI